MARQLTERELEARKEIIMPLWPKELYQGWIKITHDLPLSGVKFLARKVDDIAINKRMRSGLFTVVTMPAGIVARNMARSTNYVIDKKFPGSVGGAVGAAAGWWIAGKAAFGYLTTQAPAFAAAASHAGLVGAAAKVAIAVGAGVVSGLVVLPVTFMVGTLAAATLGAAVIGTLSIAGPGLFNVPTAARRTWDRVRGIKGVNYDGEAEEKAISHDSLSARQERKTYSEVSYQIRNLSTEHQQELFSKLGETFAAAAANQNQQQVTATAAAAPAAKAPTP